MADEQQFQQCAEKIERLTERVQSLADPEARAAALELMQAVLHLHADCMERMVETIFQQPRGPEMLEEMAADPMIAGLLLLYGLHPEPLEERVLRSLEKVRPYLESHGGNVELLGIEGSTVRLQLVGSCKSCPSSSATLKQAVERAIYEVAPDVTAIVAEQEAEAAAASQLVQLR
jgi:Fe-S cluster biogenesis protein NfuA